MSQVPVIKGSKFILRELNPEKDKKSFIKNINDPEIMKWLSFDYPYTEDSWKWFVNHCQEIKSSKSGNFNWVIEFEGKGVGAISLSRKMKETCKHRAEFGFWIGRKYWGSGIMTEAVSLVTNYLFNATDLKKLNIDYLEENIGSGRVAEKNGYKYEAKMIKHVFKLGNYQNLIYTAKFKEGFI